MNKQGYYKIRNTNKTINKTYLNQQNMCMNIIF